MSLKWRRLHLSRQGDLPPLLFRYSIAANGYELFMTDLTNIWTERMSRRDILRRADEDATTIDPSEDVEQFKVLLEKIGEALENKPGAAASLNPRSQVDSLKLIVSVKLPTPLRPLTWTAYLTKEPASSTSRHLLLPLLKAEAAWEPRQQTLLDQLNRKDWALGKLFEKIENMGIDLSTIFPGVTGHRRAHGETLLSQAARYIKGVAPFDEAEWLGEVAKSSPESSLAANMVAELTGFDETKHVDSLDPPPDGWWEKLTAEEPATLTPPGREQAQEPTEKKHAEHDTAMETDTDTGNDDLDGDDEFERQETPPRLKKPTDQERSSPAATASTTAGTADEATHGHKATSEDEPTKHESPAKKPKGLGVIGGKKQTRPKPPTPPRAHVASEPTGPATQPKHDDDATDSDLDQSPRAAPRAPAPAEQKKPAPKSHGLGVIGGKKKEKFKTPTPRTSRSPDPAPAPAPAPAQSLPKRPGKLGMIGGKARKLRDAAPETQTRAEADAQAQARSETPPQAKSESTEDLPVRGTVKKSASSSVAPPPEPPREETEHERADRKREELKRQLEAKSKAPAKKKRRF
ncbi:uncharacterized protein ACLA_091770 [Aspergillus clavatus NRRL 1]|uniref:Non-homologous end-joining factor 1 n=1 Tax=Aspergillus clavatus (strain ATCC 1007 / CBS 513.65 / DSM 816 / NCTC 3887 / NRRL 1 / QM 1276 / 107) TaxID=344612 RepID=A1CF30_ASPCL|nr:uncharacterized protein ACLA_091770 [Aspergillus clavatus NRRL 1]EAW11479.1 conserved hypothetical protein [Aspergillus clavatus NRRL 1]